MKWNVNVQVEAEDQFGVTDILAPLKGLKGVTVGGAVPIKEAQTQVAGSRTGGQLPENISVRKLPTTTERVAVP